MIVTTSMLVEQYKDFSDPYRKIRQQISGNKLIPVVRGIYETDPSISGYVLAPVIYGPSYLSLDYALARYGLIPEAVYEYTSVTCGKLKKKQYLNVFGSYSYRDIPAAAYPYGFEILEEGGYQYAMACPEKALCDKIYTSPLANTVRDMELLLLESMRMEPENLKQLNRSDISEISEKYRSTNVRLLSDFLRRLK